MDLIVGLPGEDLKKVQYTLDEIKRMAPDSITVHSLAVKRAARPVSYTHLDVYKRQVADAEGGTYQNENGAREYAVSLKLTKEGKKKFAEATEANVGKQIAIVYDNAVLSAPTVPVSYTHLGCRRNSGKKRD